MSPEETTDTDDAKKASDFRRFLSQVSFQIYC